MTPKISIFGPSHRTHLWKPFFESIVTDLDFEVIFVTDKLPKVDEIPNDQRFRWIYSKVKPAQCFEIGYRRSTGTHVIWTGDDFTYSPYCLDNLYYMHKSFYDYKVMISCNPYQDGISARHEHYVPWDDSIRLTTTGLISKQAIEEVGGWGDINFVCGHHDTDVMMRIYCNGGRLFECPTALSFEPHNAFHAIEANFAIDWKDELNYFTQCWKMPDGTTAKTRQKPFVPYTDKDILISSQGNLGISGKWK